MTAAGNTLLTLLIFWGLPVYLIDRRARRNERPGWVRFTIAFFMFFYFLIVPVFVAISLAGPKRPRRSQRETGFLAASTRYAETQRRPEPEQPLYDHYHASQDEDDRAARANEQRYQEHQLALARRRRDDAEARQRPDPEPSRHSQTRPYITPQQRLEKYELNQHRLTRERQQQHTQQRLDTNQRTAEREAYSVQARLERQERADCEREAQNDLFMTWDERGEEELAD